MSTDKPFFMVVGNGVPYVRHATLEIAKREAERLARQWPGNEFVVLMSTYAVRVSDVTWKSFDVANEIPF